MTALAALMAGLAVWLAAETVAGRPLQWHRRDPIRARWRVSRQVWLSQAGAAVSPAQFWAVSTGLAAVAFVILLAVDRAVIVAAVPAAGMGAVPYGYWAAQRRRQAGARAEAWPDALRHVGGALGAGISTLHDALVELSISGPEPLRPPMARYVRLADRVGTTAALEAVRAELADPVSDAVLLTFETAATEGTAVVLRVLDGLQRQVTGDLALAEKVRTLQTQSRVAAWASLVIPYVLLVFLCASTVAYRSFYSSGAGLAVVIVGAAGSLSGFFLVRRLARPVATTERVFTGPGNKPAGRSISTAVLSPGRRAR